MSKQLNILFIPRWYPNRVSPFNGIFIKRHALTVSLKHRVGVLFVNADPGLKGRNYDLEQNVEDGIFTVRAYYNNSVPGIPLLSSLIKFYRYSAACRMGIKIIDEKFGQPDVCHIHVLSRTFIPARHFRVPFIVSEQWSGYLPEDGMYKGLLKKWLTKRAVRKAKAVTTVSRSLKDAMLAHGLKNEYHVIPNVIDSKIFHLPQENTTNQRPVLLHVSNLDDRAKNVSGMIRAVKKLADAGIVFEFRIVGDGPERNSLEALAERLGLLNRIVFFIGSKSPDDVASLMKKADLFLLFSNYDNMPCVMAEALACGLPVIGSAVHGIAEHINNSRGAVVPAGDEDAFAAVIKNALENSTRFDKKALHEYSVARFSYEAVAEQFNTLYQKAIAQ